MASLGSDANPDIIVPIPVKEKLASTIIRRTKPMLANGTLKSKLPITSKTRALMTPITAPAIVFPTMMEVDETGAAKIRSKTPKDLSHTILMVSLMLPNIAVIPTMPGIKNVENVGSGPVAPYLKLNVNIMKIGKRRLHTTWRTDLND